MTLPLFETTRGVNFSFRFRSRLLSNSERRRPGTHSVRWSTCYNRSTDLGTVPRRSSCRNTSESEAWRNTCEKVLTVLSNRFVAGFPAIRPTSSNRSRRHEHSADERITSRPRKDEHDYRRCSCTYCQSRRLFGPPQAYPLRYCSSGIWAVHLGRQCVKQRDSTAFRPATKSVDTGRATRYAFTRPAREQRRSPHLPCTDDERPVATDFRIRR